MKAYLALELLDPEALQAVEDTTQERHPIKFPEGCYGIAVIFKYKKDARKWFGRDVPLLDIDLK